MNLFKKLSEEETKEFKQWARDNYDPATMNISPIWHPVVKQECLVMCEEFYGEPKQE